MNNIRISLLGKLQIQHFINGPIKLEKRRDQELLCYLLLNRSRLHEREKLAGLMWEESSTTQSKRNLRQTLWHIQSTLNAGCDESSILLAENGWIGVNLDADFWLDVAVIEEAYASLETLDISQLSHQQASMLEQATQLYQGDLLEGCYQDWCIYERERFQNMHLAMLDYLLRYSEAQHDYACSIAYGVKILRYDRAREQTHRQLMRLYYLMGDRSAAIHQYELCSLALHEELGVTPAQSTEALYDLVRSEQAVSRISSAGNSIFATDANLLEENTLHRLEKIQYALTNLQEQVSQLILELKSPLSR